MPVSPTVSYLGTSTDNDLSDGFTNQNGETLASDADTADSVNGLEGNDVISTGLGNDLAAGDMVGDEWVFVDGKWVFVPSALVSSAYGQDFSFDDLIQAGAGDDVLLGNGGNDSLYAGLGDDIVNAGRGSDFLFGDHGDDTLNLEAGDDIAEGGQGADIVNGGAGNDVIFGDENGRNFLRETDGATTLAQHAKTGGWTLTGAAGQQMISQTAATVAGETYTITFDLAANLSGGHSAAAVDVIWNGQTVETVQATSGVFSSFEIEVQGQGSESALSFRSATPAEATPYDTSGPIASYDKAMTIGGTDVTVSAFAPGQAKLYQVIDGQLNVFDPAGQTYTAVGAQPDFKINGVGYNIEDDLIYGVAKSTGTDSLGNAVAIADVVMIDAEGATYRIGKGYYGDYVGDFDDKGNLWTFHSALNRISIIDVDALDANGNPTITYHHFPAGMFTDRTFDLAFDAATNSFIGVIAPQTQGGHGKVVRIDVSDVMNGGKPTFTEIAVTATLQDGAMIDGMAKGAYGAVFFDGSGNIYYGLNSGDHDMDASTGRSGAIFKINADWEAGTAYSEFMSDAPVTGSNDGAVDPRSTDAFAQTETDAPLLLRNASLTIEAGGNDTLRGGTGDDTVHGDEGDDVINGGAGEDLLYGDEGADRILGAADGDTLYGGAGNDSLLGNAGSDDLDGGADADYLHGGNGYDALAGGDGQDKRVGGLGQDTLEGGAGNDHIWGGDWAADGMQDVFVFKAGSGRDFVHDFEAGTDLVDLTFFETGMDAVLNAAQDKGWATVIDLAALDGGQAEDRLILKSVDLADLTQDSFIF